MEDYRLEQTGQEVQRILNGAAMEANLQAEVERATDAEGTLQENIDAEAQARQDADSLLQQGIDDEKQRAKDAEEANAGEIEGIKALIPSTASDANKLADTNYVNSSIQTATAEYRGDYNVVTDLHLAIDATHAQIETLLPTVIAEADKNDYCYVMIPTSAQTPTEIAKIERYKMTSEGWKFEYDVNNSTFTAEEWAAIKSGITSGLVAKLNALPTNADLLLLLAGKQDVLTFDSVPVPESNNPVKSGGVYSAIDDEKTARLNSDTAIHTELDGLQAKVPATASSDNKLVDQNQMNSSISTATATFRGDWNVVSDLHLAVDATRAQIAALLPTVISTADNNDYCYVEIPTSAETPAQIERVERYKFNGTAWGYEYTLNNSGFTADQWAAINSMITSGLVAKLSALPTNADLLAMLAQKQDNLTFDSTPTENSTNPVTSGGVFAADKALSDAIEAILLLIPSAASSLNKLVDTALLNSSISTATATFKGTYNLVSDLGLGIDATEGQIAAALLSAISTADNNDYAFVQIPTSAEAPAQIARTDRYKFNGTVWAYEYTLNTSGFTAAQWAAINSTITSALVAKLNALPTAAELQEALGTLTSGITAINQKIPSTASQSNMLVDNASMESYITQVINILDASFNVTSTDGHITLHITQVDGKITAVQVQSTDIASAADLALKASQADLTALASRVTTAEGNITSLTGRIGTAETNIANLQQIYNDLQQSKPVPVIALPSTGQQQGVIYRLAGTTSYSDYMWDGSSWVLMATYNNAIDPRPKKASQNLVTSGGVFDNIGALDVSELNATENPHTLAQYADLSSALAAIPTDYQKGGMSIKFVQSSDNKYVQYRLVSDSFNTTPSNWQKSGAEVSVSQNTSTGHIDLTIGDTTTPLPSFQDVDNVEFLIDEKQIIPSDAWGWSAYKDCSMRSGIVYVLSNVSNVAITMIEFRDGTTAAGSITNALASGASIEFTPTRNIDNLRMYASSAVLEIKAKYNKFEDLDDSVDKVNDKVDADALLVAQRIEFRGYGWAEKEYKMESALTYNIKKVDSNGSIIAAQALDSDNQQVTVTGFSTLTNLGDNCNIRVARDCVKIKLYFDGQTSVEIKNNILDYVLSSFDATNEKDSEQDASISQLEAAVFDAKKNSGSGWGDWTAYTFHRGYSYKITNISSNSSSRIIAFNLKGVTYSGDTISDLAPGQTATIIPNADASEFRAYFNGGDGTIEIKGTLNITEDIYALKKGVEIQEGFSSKDQIQHQVIVSKDGAEGHYATIAEAYAAITDSSYTNQYEVIVYPGKYNELNLIPPAFTHTHGLAPNSVVVSSEGVNPSSTLPVFDQQVSSTKLSNMTIESHNGYCIHFDERLSGQVIMNENLRLVKAATPNNTWYVVGGGSFQFGTKYIWKNCVFSSLGNFGQAACHTNGNLVNDNTHLVFDSCSFINCNPRNGSVGGFGNCVVELINCQFPIGVRGLENWYSPIRNIDNPALYRFNKNEWQVIGGGNKNLSMWQSQSGKTIRLVADYPITISGTAASVIFGYNPTVNNVKTARLNCTLTSEYYIADEQAGYPPYSEARDVFQLWKRLGDCSMTNKTLTVTVNNVSKTYTFAEDYLTSKTAQSTIIAAMQAVLDNVTIEAITQSGYGYFNVNTSDCLMVKVMSDDILKGEFVTNTGYKATSATAIKDIVGVACEDKPINEFVKVWTSAFRFDTDYADGEYGLDANGALDSNAATKIGFIKGYNFYLY